MYFATANTGRFLVVVVFVRRSSCFEDVYLKKSQLKRDSNINLMLKRKEMS